MTSDVDLCVSIVSLWSREVLDGRGYGDYRSMGLSGGQYDILREVVDAARTARRQGKGTQYVGTLTERQAREGCVSPVPLRRARRGAVVMSGVGPVEPDGDTRPLDPPSVAPHVRSGPPARRSRRHRRTTAATLLAVAVLAGGALLYLTRPRPEPAPEPRFPSQTTSFRYLYMQVRDAGTTSAEFEFTMQAFTESDAPVTVLGISQPYAGLSLTSRPATPLRVNGGGSRKIAVTVQVTECGKVPRNAGLPFLDVTLRNTRAKEAHSYILGARYARDLSTALEVACSNGFR
ncbi:Tat pathway signal sequence domain protein [Streptomyces albogriseolus]|uniref:Tat pathway signal sequence domain protein n=1 Tax=Streptomyces albogriseolus TaxID=1887 RepID=UPI0033AEF435